MKTTRIKSTSIFYNKTWMIHNKTFYWIASHLRLDILLIYQHKKPEKNKECTESTFLHQTSIVRRVTSRIIIKLACTIQYCLMDNQQCVIGLYISKKLYFKKSYTRRPSAEMYMYTSQKYCKTCFPIVPKVLWINVL